MKLTLSHADTCLPDYWGGHHKAHISIPVYRGMTLAALKAYLKAELADGAVMGSDDLAEKLNGSCEESYRAAKDAVNAIAQTKPGEPLFMDLEEYEPDDDHPVYAYFVFTDQED